MTTPDRICVAKIATAHGVRGLVKLHVFVDDLDLLKGTLYTSETTDDTLSINLKNATTKHWLAEVNDINDRTDAEKLRGTNLYIDKSALPELSDDEMYIADMIGLPVEDEDGNAIGKVIAFENFGASDLIEIKPITSASFYLPFVDETIIDKSADKIIVKIPGGLLD